MFPQLLYKGQGCPCVSRRRGSKRTLQKNVQLRPLQSAATFSLITQSAAVSRQNHKQRLVACTETASVYIVRCLKKLLASCEINIPEMSRTRLFSKEAVQMTSSSLPINPVRARKFCPNNLHQSTSLILVSCLYAAG
jgi:hypothetical protein